MESWPRRHRITVDEYYRMAEIGVLAPDARVELIEGEIIDVAPIGSRHASVVDELTYLLVHAVGRQAIVRVQSAVRLSRITEPEPDLAVLAARTDYYRQAHPSGEDTLLVIEVADSSLAYDKDVKVPLYARHGVREVWIVDLQNARVLVYHSPADGKYGYERTVTPPGVLAATHAPNVSVDLARLLAP